MHCDLFMTFLEKNSSVFPEECTFKCISLHTLKK